MDDDQEHCGYPTWIDETVRFLLIVASCGAVLAGIYQFAQVIGWLPDLWWLP